MLETPDFQSIVCTTCVIGKVIAKESLTLADK